MHQLTDLLRYVFGSGILGFLDLSAFTFMVIFCHALLLLEKRGSSLIGTFAGILMAPVLSFFCSLLSRPLVQAILEFCGLGDTGAHIGLILAELAAIVFLVRVIAKELRAN